MLGHLNPPSPTPQHLSSTCYLPHTFLTSPHIPTPLLTFPHISSNTSPRLSSPPSHFVDVNNSVMKVAHDHRIRSKNMNGRESNRLKYRSGSGSGSRNFIFNGSGSRLFKNLGSGSVRVQLLQNLKVRVRFRFIETKFLRFRFGFKSNLHYTRRITPKRVTSCGAHLRSLAPGLHSSEETSQRWRVVGDTVPI